MGYSWDTDSLWDTFVITFENIKTNRFVLGRQLLESIVININLELF